MNKSADTGLTTVSVPRTHEELMDTLSSLAAKQTEKLKQAGLWPPPKTPYQIKMEQNNE